MMRFRYLTNISDSQLWNRSLTVDEAEKFKTIAHYNLLYSLSPDCIGYYPFVPNANETLTKVREWGEEKTVSIPKGAMILSRTGINN